MQTYSILDVWRGSEYACVQIPPGNVLCDHNEHLMDISNSYMAWR